MVSGVLPPCDLIEPLAAQAHASGQSHHEAKNSDGHHTEARHDHLKHGHSKHDHGHHSNQKPEQSPEDECCSQMSNVAFVSASKIGLILPEQHLEKAAFDFQAVLPFVAESTPADGAVFGRDGPPGTFYLPQNSCSSLSGRAPPFLV